MATEADPITGNWYKHLDKGYEFRVVSVDEDEGIVEIQHFDGDIEALDMDSWYETDVEPIEPPEDWTGPVDDIGRDDLGYTETDMEKEDWTESLDELSAREEREEARWWKEEEE